MRAWSSSLVNRWVRNWHLLRRRPSIRQQTQLSKGLSSEKQSLIDELSTANAEQGTLQNKLIQVQKELQEEDSAQQQAVENFEALKHELGALQSKFEEQVRDI